MNRLSLSKRGLAAKCLYSFREDVRITERPTGEPAAIGRVVHSMVEAHVLGKAVIDDVDEAILAKATAIFNGPLKAYLDTHKWTVCEAGYRYDSLTDTCSEGPRRGEPGYDDVPSHVLHGTVDLVAIEGDTALVVDVKTGKPPTDSEQLYGQAVCISRKFGVPNARVMYARALKTKLDLLDDEYLDADRLDAEAGRIAKQHRMLPMAEPVEGEHCWRCDAWSSCPAKRDKRDAYVEPDPPVAAHLADDAKMF